MGKKTGHGPKPIVVADIRVTIIYSRGQRADGRWYWRARRGGGQQHLWAGWHLRDEAEARAVETAAAQPAVPVRQQGRETVGTLLDAWFTTTAPTHANASTRSRYGQTARRVTEMIGDIPLRNVTTTTYRKFRAVEREAGYAPATIEYGLNVLRMAWRWGREVGIAPVEMPKIPKIRVERVRPAQTPTWDEIWAVVDHVRELGRLVVADTLALQAFTGARIGEVCALRSADVEPIDGGFMLTLGALRGARKTGRRKVPVFAEGAGLVRRLLEDGESTQLLQASRSGGRLSAWVQEVLRSRVDWPTLRIQRFTTHGIRYRVVQRMARSGVPVAHAAKVTGHSPMVMLRIYAQVTEADLRAAVETAGLGRREFAPRKD